MRDYAIAQYSNRRDVWHLVQRRDDDRMVGATTVCEDGAVQVSAVLDVAYPVPGRQFYGISEIDLLLVSTGMEVCDVCEKVAKAAETLDDDEVMWAEIEGA